MPLDDVRLSTGGVLARVLDQKPLVLVVEDDVDAAELVAQAFYQNGCDVLVRRDARSALDAARELPAPDLIVVDVDRLGAAGHDVLRELRHDVSISWIPVVVLSDAPHGLIGYATERIARREILDGLARVVRRLTRPHEELTDRH